MNSNQRKIERKSLATFTPAYALNPKTLLGYVEDLTVKGAMIIGEKTVETGKHITLSIEITLADTAKRLVAATNRDDVADALIEYLGAHYARAVLFMVVAGQVTGWRAVRNRQPIPAIEQFQLPLTEASVLKTAVESNSFFLGPVPQSGANLALTTLLGKPAPATAVMLPLAMLGRVVGLIYVDDPEVNMAETVAELQQVTAKALLTFELLILQNKILRT